MFVAALRLAEDGLCSISSRRKTTSIEMGNRSRHIPTDVDPNDPASLDAVYSKVDARKKVVSKNFIGCRYENHLGSGLTAIVDAGKEYKFDFKVTSK